MCGFCAFLWSVLGGCFGEGCFVLYYVIGAVLLMFECFFMCFLLFEVLCVFVLLFVCGLLCVCLWFALGVFWFGVIAAFINKMLGLYC